MFGLAISSQHSAFSHYEPLATSTKNLDWPSADC
jgi:hypothetical protein